MKTYPRLRRCALVVALLAALPAAAGAKTRQDPCPAWAQPDLPRLERIFAGWRNGQEKPFREGRRLDETFDMWNRGAWLALPYGYINPWTVAPGAGPRTRAERIRVLAENAHVTGYDAKTGRYNPALLRDRDDASTGWLAFWMPSGRPVETNLRWAPWARPCERGRPPAGDEEHVVKFEILWPGRPGADQAPAARWFRAFAHDYRNPTGEQTLVDRGEVTALASCTYGVSCDVRVWDRARDIMLRVLIRDFVRRDGGAEFWVAPATTALDLVAGWLREGRARAEAAGN